IALRVMPIDGLTVVANVPLQDFDFSTATRQGSDFVMNWGANYTMENVFAVGVGYVGTFDNAKNPWSMYAGVSLPVIPFVKPEIFMQTYTIGTHESKISDNGTDLYNSFDLGIRLNMEFGNFLIQPEFDISIVSWNKNQKDTISDLLKDFYKNPIIIGIPMFYTINETITVGLVPAFATGVLAYNKVVDGLKDEWRLSFDPRVAINTKIGTFTVRGGIIVDSYVNNALENATKTNFLVELGWHYYF
ncbi:MAG: hypothetical protein ACRC5H_07915, partial [Treponemataceae bacterium]